LSAKSDDEPNIEDSGMTTIIDSHTHIWESPEPAPAPLPYHSATRETLTAEMATAGAARAVLIQPSIYGRDHTYLQHAVADDPDRFAAVVLLDPNDPDIATELDRLRAELPVRGIRLRVKDAATVEAIDSGQLDSLFARLSRDGLVQTFLTYPRALDAIARLGQRHPALRIVVDHFGSPDQGRLADPDYLQSLERLARTPNVLVKLSGFYALSSEPYPHRDFAPLTARAVDLFGPGRLMWGSDFPFVAYANPYSASIDQLRELLPMLSTAESESIFFHNAAGLFWP
jgi:L-fuconolactonase